MRNNSSKLIVGLGLTLSGVTLAASCIGGSGPAFAEFRAPQVRVPVRVGVGVHTVSPAIIGGGYGRRVRRPQLQQEAHRWLAGQSAGTSASTSCEGGGSRNRFNHCDVDVGGPPVLGTGGTTASITAPTIRLFNRARRAAGARRTALRARRDHHRVFRKHIAANDQPDRATLGSDATRNTKLSADRRHPLSLARWRRPFGAERGERARKSGRRLQRAAQLHVLVARGRRSDLPAARRAIRPNTC